MAIDLPDGALLHQHEGEATVDHGTGGGHVSLLCQDRRDIPHAGDGQLGGEDHVGDPQRKLTGGGYRVGHVEAEIAVEGDITCQAASGYGLTDHGQMTDIAHQDVADALLQDGGQAVSDSGGLTVKDHGGHQYASFLGGNVGGMLLAQGEVQNLKVLRGGVRDLIGGVEASGATDVGGFAGGSRRQAV